MKNIKISLLTAIVVAFIINGCGSTEQRAKQAEQKVEKEMNDVADAKKEAVVAEQKAVDEKEWKLFELQTSQKITKNQLRIVDLKLQMKANQTDWDQKSMARVDSLEQANAKLKMRLSNFHNGQTDWESFKRELGNDVDGLGIALKNFVINKK
ncbi:MAG: hypothetical protein RLY16_2251 [Bacteroidota bacterium]